MVGVEVVISGRRKRQFTGQVRLYEAHGEVGSTVRQMWANSAEGRE
jgi:hypothetical protein